MPPLCNNPNSTRMGAFASRLCRLPQYSQGEVFGTEMAPGELIPPGVHRQPDIISLTVPLLQLFSESEEIQIQRRIEELYALHLDNLISSNTMAFSADPIFTERRISRTRSTVVKRRQSDELIFSACVLQVLSQTLTDVHKTFLYEYQKLRTMCLVQPPLDSSIILDQLKVIDNNAIQMKAAKCGLLEEYRRLENQLREYDMQLNPMPEKVRIIWRNVTQLLDLYSQI